MGEDRKTAGEDLPQTTFFVDARAVFQGGGCRGAAYAGAYEAAVRCGARFSEVAGTSAGSIVAALIGAGASPEFVQTEMRSLEFKRFMSRPRPGALDDVRARSVLTLPPLSWLLERFDLARIALYGGAYSSEAIQTWMDDLLHKLLPCAARPVQFKDLFIPTSVVSTDLGSGVAKVWSTDKTPNESVALAVRASCSIPGFFQPVQIGTTRHVDGGLLSNLPAFIFDTDAGGKSVGGGRVLAFSLVDEYRPISSWNLRSFSSRLINTVVDGSTDLQAQIHKQAHIVEIRTPGISATDFDKMDEARIDQLVRSGWHSTVAFIKNEGVNLRGGTAGRGLSADSNELFDSFVREAREPGLELWISDSDTRWYWELFPIILSWREAGAAVRYLTLENKAQGDSGKRESQRRGLMAAIGIDLMVTDSLPWRGMLVHRHDDNRDAAFVCNESKTSGANFASAYIGNTHREVIRSLGEHLKSTASTVTYGGISLSEADPDPLIDRLRVGVWQYAKPGVEIALERINLANLLLINSRVRTFKLRQAEIMATVYARNKIDLFKPAHVLLDGVIASTTTPPVVENWGDKSVVVEGNSRVLYAISKGITRMDVFHVRNVKDQLPGKPVEPRKVLLVSRFIPPEDRIDGFDYDSFRNIEAAARPI
jgi:predicted acylesterase/phospholipase RssA